MDPGRGIGIVTLMSVRDDVKRGISGSPVTTMLVVASAFLCAAAAFYAGLYIGTDQKLKVVLPLVIPAAILFGVMALTRFGAFVLLLLGARASLDLIKLSGSSAGNVTTNSAAARGIDPSSILAVIFLLASFLWLAAQWRRNGRLHGTLSRYAFMAFLAACLCSALGSSRMGASLLEFARILAVLMMFVVLEELAIDRRWVERLLTAAFASALYPLAYTLFTMATGHVASEVKGSFARISGPFAQSTTFGRYLAFLIIFGVAIQPHLARRWQRVWMALILSVSTLFLLLTLTRGALFACIVGVVIVALSQGRYRLLGGLVVGGMVALALVPGLLSRLSELGSTQAVGGAPTGNTLDWRLRYWTDVLPLADTNPVTGVGLNVTQYLTVQEKQPHNDFIRAYVEIGAFGLITYCLWLASFVRLGLEAVRCSARGTFERGIAAGFLGCVIAFVGQSLGANVMSNVVSLWYLVAFAAAASYVVHRGPAGAVTTGHIDTSGRGPHLSSIKPFEDTCQQGENRQ